MEADPLNNATSTVIGYSSVTLWMSDLEDLAGTFHIGENLRGEQPDLRLRWSAIQIGVDRKEGKRQEKDSIKRNVYTYGLRSYSQNTVVATR